MFQTFKYFMFSSKSYTKYVKIDMELITILSKIQSFIQLVVLG